MSFPRSLPVLILLVTVGLPGEWLLAGESSATHRVLRDLPYRTGEGLDDYQRERCRLDLHLPVGKEDFATVVWFHGGGLKSGKREAPAALLRGGLAVVAVDYRLHPRVKAPAYLEDAAASVAWTLANIGKHGGRADLVFVAGHSAGGYLTSMIGLDARWLGTHGVRPERLAGLIPYSGHAITHFTVRAERGIPGTRPVIDSLAPLFHVRPDAPPILLITGDRELEFPARYEENAYLWRMFRVVGHPRARLLEIEGTDHSGMVQPGHPHLLEFVEKISREIRKRGTEDSSPRD